MSSARSLFGETTKQDNLVGSTGLETEDYIPESSNEISQLEAGLAGIASGLIKIPEGVVSLGAELIDLGLDTNTAVEVEQFFDKINPFEEIAEQKAAGKITEALTQVVSIGTAGAKLGVNLANKALKAKKSGQYLNLKAPNLTKGVKKAKDLNVYGYILKEFALEEIENCLKSVSEGKPFFSPKISDMLGSNANKDDVLEVLTPSEKKILKLIAMDKTNKDIASLLFISHRTVEKHRSNIISKLNLEHKTNSLLIWAKEHQEKLQ